MRYKIQSVQIVVESVPEGDATDVQSSTFEIGAHTNFGWRISGVIPVFPRWMALMTTISEVLRLEK